MYNYKMLPLLLAVGLAACASTTGQSDLSQSSLVELPLAEHAPTPEQINKAPSIIVLAPKPAAEVQGYFTVEAQQHMHNLLTNAGNNVIDRNLTSQVLAELEYAEANGIYRSSGPAIAEIAIMGTMTRASWYSKYQEASSYTDKKGKTHNTPASCDYNGRATIIYRAYSLPDMQMLASYEMEGRSKHEQKNIGSSCRDNQVNIPSLISSAVRDAIESNSIQILDDLSRPFYVLERRQPHNDRSRSLFRINAGLGNGAEPNLTVRIYRVNKRVVQLTGETLREELQIAEGRITADIDQHGSYVVVRGDDIHKIQAGDIARIVRNTCRRGQSRVFGVCI